MYEREELRMSRPSTAEREMRERNEDESLRRWLAAVDPNPTPSLSDAVVHNDQSHFFLLLPGMDGAGGGGASNGIATQGVNTAHADAVTAAHLQALHNQHAQLLAAAHAAAAQQQPQPVAVNIVASLQQLQQQQQQAVAAQLQLQQHMQLQQLQQQQLNQSPPFSHPGSSHSAPAVTALVGSVPSSIPAVLTSTAQSSSTSVAVSSAGGQLSQHTPIAPIAPIPPGAGAIAVGGVVLHPNVVAQIQALAGGGAAHMPWPMHQPAVNVPFFDVNLYKNVNLDVSPSEQPSGLDLPLHDVTTLRFFFNLGVQQSRVVLLSQHLTQIQQSQNGPQTPAPALQPPPAAPPPSQNGLMTMNATNGAFSLAHIQQLQAAMAAASGQPLQPQTQQPAVHSSTPSNSTAHDIGSQSGHSGFVSPQQLIRLGLQSHQQQQAAAAALQQVSAAQQHHQQQQQQAQAVQQAQAQQQAQQQAQANAMAQQHIELVARLRAQQIAVATGAAPSADASGLGAALAAAAQNGVAAQQQLLQQQRAQLLAAAVAAASQPPPSAPSSVPPAPTASAIPTPTGTVAAAGPAPSPAAAAAVGKPAAVVAPHANMEALLLQQALLASTHANEAASQRAAISLNDLRLQLANSQQHQPHPFGFLSAVSGLGTAAAMASASAPSVTASGSNPAAHSSSTSPRPPIPVDPAPRAELARLVQQQQSAISAASSQNQPTDRAAAIEIIARQINRGPFGVVETQTTMNSAPPSSGSSNGSSSPSRKESRGDEVIAIACSLPPGAASLSLPPPVTRTVPHSSPSRNALPSAAENTLIHLSEQHFTDAFKKQHMEQTKSSPGESHGPKSSVIGIALSNSSDERKSKSLDGSDSSPLSGGSPKSITPTIKAEEGAIEHPALAPILMMSYLNSCMGKAKTALQNRGASIGVLDANGKPVDYSSRPVDPIFKTARQQLDSVREFKDTGSTLAVSANGGNTQTPLVQPAPSPETVSPALPKRPRSNATDGDADDRSSMSSGSPGEKRLRIATEDE